MKKYGTFAMIIFLTACEGFKGPSFSDDPSKMSADTLCYREAYAKDRPEIHSEITARNLDCSKLLEPQKP